MQIRLAGPPDLPAALQVISDAFGMPVRDPSVHTLVARHRNGRLFVAELDGEIVGTAGSMSFGPTGWIGAVAVTEAARGARLGQRLTEVAIDALGPVETVLLLASDAGRPIYERLGFEAELAYPVFLSPEGFAPASAPLRTLNGVDREAVLALDRRVTGEDRAPAVAAALDGAVATPDLAAVALRPPWPARPLLARDPEAGQALLGAVLEPGMRLAVPEANTAAIAALHELGMQPTRSVVRMRRGPAVAWRPDELWGVFSLFFG